MVDKIFNEDCFITMSNLPIHSVDVVLTSPFYNTNKKCGKDRTLLNTKVKKKNYHYARYDKHVDNMTDDEYNDFTVRLFENFDRVLKKNGVVLYNINYGTENTDGMFLAINDIITRTPFTIADVIGWKKSTALPNSCSMNKLTRIFEFVFVLCRKEEFKTFYCNKPLASKRSNGQQMYKNVYNYIEAPNNDEACPYNKATYSSKLCEELLKLYAPSNGLVYDPFMGSGTTAIACINLNLHYIGSEISENQCKWAKQRIERHQSGQSVSEWLTALLED